MPGIYPLPGPVTIDLIGCRVEAIQKILLPLLALTDVEC